VLVQTGATQIDPTDKLFVLRIAEKMKISAKLSSARFTAGFEVVSPEALFVAYLPFTRILMEREDSYWICCTTAVHTNQSKIHALRRHLTSTILLMCTMIQIFGCYLSNLDFQEDHRYQLAIQQLLKLIT
jgi:hypothetical protein